MSLIPRLRTMYRRYIHVPAIDRFIYALLDAATHLYSALRGFYFPKKFIRRWKLDYLWELYEKETVVVFKKTIKPGMVVVDIGAHIGYFTRMFSKLVGTTGIVYAYEADPENFSFLQKNTKHLSNVKIFPLAITDTQGTIDFYHYPDKAGCHSILSNVPLDFRKEKISVPCEDLDSLITKQKIDRVDYIKMDIEGGETAALRGMKKLLENPLPITLVIEFAPAWIHAAGNSPLTFLQNLTARGFKIFAIKDSARLISIIPDTEKSFQELLPKTPTPFNEFINIYCVRT